MKAIKFSTLLALGLILTLAVTGCHTKRSYFTPIPKKAGGIGGTGPESTESGGKLAGGESITGTPDTGIPQGQGHPGWAEDRAHFANETVHFAFDSSAVRSEDKSKVEAVADYLKSSASAAIKIEGHCDERGTAEYNRALGERRALALREAIVGLGIDATRVDTISYGFDRPVAPGHNETAWSQNRRGEFILLTPPAK